MSSPSEWLGITPGMLRNLRESGDVTASILIALLIESGVIRPEHSEEARNSMWAAADKHPLANYALAREILRNNSNDSQLQKFDAVKLLREASDAGLAEASTLLGLLHEAGVRCTQDLNVARHFYQIGADQGDPQGCGHLGAMYVDDKGEISEPAIAIRYFKNAVDGGHWPSVPHLAKLYFQSQDPEKIQNALNLLRNGADSGDIGCLFRLASIYMHGEYGVKSDHEYAKSLYERAQAALAKKSSYF